MEFCKFPSIEQFRHAIKTIQRHYTFVGLSSNGKAIYDATKPLPTLKFSGTIKLHGTNAAIGYCDSLENVWCQTRSMVLTENIRDQFGFYSWVQEKQKLLQTLCKSVPHNDDEKVYIFGEWCGGSVQKGVALQKLPKMFVIFAIVVAKKLKGPILQTNNNDDDNDDDNNYAEENDEIDATSEKRWFPAEDVQKIKSPQNQIYNIYDFETHMVEIDFNRPEIAQETLTTITKRVEKCCPVALALGSNGTGEGLVWTLYPGQNVKENLKNLRFKTKGDEHSVTKTKEIAAIDTEKQESIAKFVTFVVTENRLKQGIQQVFRNNEKPSLAKTSHFVRWIENDVLKEEKDTLADSGLEQKEAMKQVSNEAKKWFTKYCKTSPGKQ